ncbi:MAG: helix-turn-helix transcriptional regulator [Clostridia bacterium]|jgi:transcriptional regulator with XRE-family HTH domain|nr:helix-turn-helix transcriptional regulator [Clostridia bacterium]MCI9177497.1 helix-turn-helix transcriptional regulator [Clostridia bacterium]
MNRIKQLRDEQKMSQSELGKKLNKTQQQISLYENGTNELDLDGYIILSKLFGCSIEYIARKIRKKKP